jgi:hypothetical protein
MPSATAEPLRSEVLCERVGVDPEDLGAITGLAALGITNGLAQYLRRGLALRWPSDRWRDAADQFAHDLADEQEAGPKELRASGAVRPFGNWWPTPEYGSCTPAVPRQTGMSWQWRDPKCAHASLKSSVAEVSVREAAAWLLDVGRR